MKSVSVAQDTWWVGVNDRVTHRFEGLWQLSSGVSYNSYLINDEKVALIDGVKADFFAEYLDRIEQIIGPQRKVDYLIVNHMEPDHSGAIKMLRKIYPDLVAVGNRQTLKFLGQFYGPDSKTLEIADGGVLDLGHHHLQFALIPMVHWPETMVSFDTSTGVLFSCDAFGSYGSLDGSIFDDEIDMEALEDETRRYYATIVGRFGANVQQALKKCSTLPIRMICPSHGPVHRTGVKRVIDLYDRMSRQVTVPGAVIVYGSMYGNTARLAEAIAEGMKSSGMALKDVKLYSASTMNLSEVIRDIWKYKGLVLVSCCYNMGIFPGMIPLLEKLENSGVANRVLALGGCYTWSKGRELLPLQALADKLHCTLVGPVVEIQSRATPEQLEQARDLGRNVAAAVVESCRA